MYSFILFQEALPELWRIFPVVVSHKWKWTLRAAGRVTHWGTLESRASLTIKAEVCWLFCLSSWIMCYINQSHSISFIHVKTVWKLTSEKNSWWSYISFYQYWEKILKKNSTFTFVFLSAWIWKIVFTMIACYLSSNKLNWLRFSCASFKASL